MRDGASSVYKGLAFTSLVVYGIIAYGVHRLGVESILDDISRFGQRCPVLLYTGWKCGFCGMTRAFIHLFDGGWRAALGLNLLSIPVFIGIPGVLLGLALRRSAAIHTPPILPVVAFSILATYAVLRNLVPGIP